MSPRVNTERFLLERYVTFWIFIQFIKSPISKGCLYKGLVPRNAFELKLVTLTVFPDYYYCKLCASNCCMNYYT